MPDENPPFLPSSTADTLRGTVLAVHNGKATVRLNAPPKSGGCSACTHGNSCGIGQLATLKTNPATQPARSLQLHLDAPPGIQAGDQVSLLAPRASLPQLALLGYVFPALAILLGAALGQSLYGRDSITALFALTAFLLALALVRFVTAHSPTRSPGLCSPSLVPLSETESPHEH